MTRNFCAALFLPLVTLCAQRPEPTFEWQKRSTTITYGAVSVGQHSLSELKVGDPWRLGMNEASTWKLAMPILIGETWLAPGEYRVNLVRTDETRCAITAAGSHEALGKGPDAQLSGEVHKASKPSKKLSIEWAKNGPPVAGNQLAKLVVVYGESELQAEGLVLGNKTVSVTGGKLAVFSVPSAQLATRETPVPIAVFGKGKEGDAAWNLLVGKTEAKLVPWMTAPTEDRGFGKIVPPDEKLQTVGTVATAEVKVDKEREVAELLESSLTKGELRLVIAFGKEAIEVRVPEPKAKAGK